MNRNVISQDLTKSLAEMVKLRNMLVHFYWEIDDEKIFAIMTVDLVDLAMRGRSRRAHEVIG